MVILARPRIGLEVLVVLAGVLEEERAAAHVAGHAEVVLDPPGGLALLDPDVAGLHPGSVLAAGCASS